MSAFSLLSLIIFAFSGLVLSVGLSSLLTLAKR